MIEEYWPVAMICVAAGLLPFDAWEISSQAPVTTWEEYAADSTGPIYSLDPLEPGVGECCEDTLWVLVWLPGHAVSVVEGNPEDYFPPDSPASSGCGRFFSIKRD